MAHKRAKSTSFIRRADDNASGAGAVMELASSLKDSRAAAHRAIPEIKCRRES
jgi:Zn-dependent M28 family amino/carboxypeptidase